MLASPWTGAAALPAVPEPTLGAAGAAESLAVPCVGSVAAAAVGVEAGCRAPAWAGAVVVGLSGALLSVVAVAVAPVLSEAQAPKVESNRKHVKVLGFVILANPAKRILGSLRALGSAAPGA